MPWATDEQVAERNRRLGLAGAMAEEVRFREQGGVPISRPNFWAQTRAAFEQENLFLNAVGALRRGSRVFGDEPGFDPEANLGGYAAFQEQFPELLRARSQAEMASIKNRIDREAQNRRTLEGMGFWRALAVFGPATLLSPENALPIGTVIRGAGIVGKAARTGLAARAAGTAARTGLEAAGAQVAAEAALQPLQGFRTAEEGAINIVGAGLFGTVLGGIGGGIGAARSKALKELMGRETLTEVAKDIEKAERAVMDPTTEVGKKFTDDLNAYLDRAEDAAGTDKPVDELTIFEDSPGVLAFGESDPMRGRLMEALEQENPKLARLVGSENRVARTLLRAMRFSPAMRLATSQHRASREIGKILTGHYVTKGDQGGLSVEGAINLFDMGARRIQIEQYREAETLMRTAFKGIDEDRVWEMVGEARLRGDKASDLPSIRNGAEYDPFAAIRNNPAAIAGLEKLSKLHRDFDQLFLRTGEVAGAHTAGPKTKGKIESIVATDDLDHLSRMIDQDWVAENRPQHIEDIKRGLRARIPVELPKLQAEKAELEAQLASATDKVDVDYLKEQIRFADEAIGRITNPNLDDLAYSVESNYRPHAPGERVAQQNPFMPRVLDIDQRYLGDALTKDVRVLQNRMIRSILPDLVLAERMDAGFGGEGRSLMRELARDIADIDSDVEKARLAGPDSDAADALLVKMGDARDKAAELRLINNARLLRGGDVKVSELQKAMRDVFAVRKRERHKRAGYQKKLREIRQDIKAATERSRNLRAERKDLVEVEKIDPDLALTHTEYFAELESTYRQVKEAGERLPPSAEIRDILSGEISEEDWHVAAIGYGYTADEVAAFQRFAELAPPPPPVRPETAGVITGPAPREPAAEYDTASEMYLAWRARRMAEAPTGIMLGPDADRFRRTVETIKARQSDKSKSYRRYYKRTERVDPAEAMRTETPGIVDVLQRRSDFIQDPVVRTEAKLIDELGEEIRKLQRAKKQIGEKLDNTENRAYIPTTKDLPDSLTPSPDVRHSVTGQVYQGRGASPEDVYGEKAVAEGRAMPVVGHAQYFAFDYGDASEFGKVTEYREPVVNNAKVVSNDDEWMALLRAANVEGLHSLAEVPLRGDDLRKATEGLQAYLKSIGHDALVVHFGANSKRLRETFSIEQMAVFDNAPRAKAKAKPRPSTVTAEELQSFRAENTALGGRILDMAMKLGKMRDERAQLRTNIEFSKLHANAATKPADDLARKIAANVGNEAAHKGRLTFESLAPRRGDLSLEGAETSEQLMRRLDALNQMVHAQVAAARRDAYSINVGTEHLKKAIERAHEAANPNMDRKALRVMEREQEAVETEVMRMRNKHGLIDGDIAEWGKRVRDFNYMTKMGSVVLSSIPDLAMAISTAGFAPYATAMIKNMRFILNGEIPKNTLAEWIYAVNRAGAVLRSEKMFGVEDEMVPRNRFDRGMAGMRENFTKWTGIRRWNAFNRAVAAQAIESRVVKTILAGEKATKQDLNLIRFFGISDDDLPDMKRLLERSHSTDKALFGDFFFANVNKWRSENPDMADFSTSRLRNLRLSLDGAILKGVHDTILEPSAGDLPTIATKHPLGRMLFQFRAFSFAAMNRFLVPGLQRTAERDARPAFSAAFATLMGMAAYATAQHLKGEDPFKETLDKDGNPESLVNRWIWEGIDRGGTLGILSEAASSIDKAMGLGLLDSSRFRSRSQFDALLGPSYGLGTDLTEALGTFSDGDLSQGEVARMRRLLPYQNLLILRAFLDLGPNIPKVGSGRYFEEFLRIDERLAGFEGYEVN